MTQHKEMAECMTNEYTYDYYLVYNHRKGIIPADVIRRQILEHMECKPNPQTAYDLFRDSTYEERNDVSHQIKMMSKCRHLVCVLTQSCLAYTLDIHTNSFFTQV